jgi:membrane-bound lytic murein transglycosylase D
MKTSILFLILSTSVCLCGCNTLATKPESGSNQLKQEDSFHTKAENKDLEAAYRRYSDATASDFLFANPQEDQCNTLLSPTATVKLDRASIPKEQPQKAAKETVTKRVARVIANKFSKIRSLLSYDKRISDSSNLWERIRAGYNLNVSHNTRIQREIDNYLKNPAYFNKISTNAKPYLYHIVEEIEQRHIPLEIALLPAIESTYEPLALSRKSAAGIWQFIPGTGRSYGLKQNAWYDGRRDVVASTQAALDYLQRLYQLFDKDWLVALAAYNYGEGNVRKAMRKNQEQSKPVDFWSLSLPRETRRYVPKLIALAEIVAKPKKYQVSLKPIQNRPYLAQIDVGEQIDLALAADLAELPPTDFKRLNACYRQDATAPEGPHNVTLPIDRADKFKKRLAKVQELMSDELSFSEEAKAVFEQDVAEFKQHRVVKGETLERIAKRYGTSAAKLRQLNGLSSNLLQIGKLLIIPTTNNRT